VLGSPGTSILLFGRGGFPSPPDQSLSIVFDPGGSFPLEGPRILKQRD
jgi:hypothetical protein